MLADIVEHLACPVCGQPLRLDPGALRCPDGHSFDVARQGYVSLLVGSRPPGTADSAEMVAARAAFLSAGHYAPLESALAEAVLAGHGESFSQSPDGGCTKAYGGSVRATAPVIVDAGAGTGHYAAAVLDAAGCGVAMAFDVSKHAVRRAARAHPRVGAFVADVWRRLPIGDGVADVVMNVFAPRNGPEFRRILRPGGRVVVVTPAPGHLSPLVEELGLLSVDADKERRVARSLEGFAEVERRVVAFGMALGPDEVRAVVGMGPSAWHVDEKELTEGIARVFAPNMPKKQEKVVTKAEFHLSTFEVTPDAR
ncbi:putative RNA methyltransferase [Nonomuraea sp. NPDC048826]|uniref:putative RNA methyltransferase n=1 Tax=Nonomuraea sp. NPDC048826 TaxID=3364347 RepID=UPI003717E106